MSIENRSVRGKEGAYNRERGETGTETERKAGGYSSRETSQVYKSTGPTKVIEEQSISGYGEDFRKCFYRLKGPGEFVNRHEGEWIDDFETRERGSRNWPSKGLSKLKKWGVLSILLVPTSPRRRKNAGKKLSRKGFRSRRALRGRRRT